MKKAVAVVLAALLLCWPLLVGCQSRSARISELLHLGERYLSDQDYQNALVTFEEILQIDGKHIDGTLGLGEAQRLLGLPDEAALAVQQVLAQDPQNPGAYELQLKLDRDNGDSRAIDDTFDYIRENGLTDTIPYGLATCSVVDALAYLTGMQQPVAGAQVEVIRGDFVVDRQQTNADGLCSLIVEQGRSVLRVQARGYITYHAEFELYAAETNYLLPVRLVPQAGGSGTASGHIIDSLTGSTVPFATMELRDSTTGELVQTHTVEADGFFWLDLPAGYYTALVSAAGYTDVHGELVVAAGHILENQNLSMTPFLETGQLRVVLTWGEAPRDLDSHMTGPSVQGKPFHTWYGGRTASHGGERVAELDLDDTDSYGPETTTIYIPMRGTYSFYVHDYTNQSDMRSTALANSGATVQVYLGEVLQREYHVPADLVGPMWYVFEFSAGELTTPSAAAPDIAELQSSAYSQGETVLPGRSLFSGMLLPQLGLLQAGIYRGATMDGLVAAYGLPDGYDSHEQLQGDMQAGGLFGQYGSGYASWYEQGLDSVQFWTDNWTVKGVGLNAERLAAPLPGGLSSGMHITEVAARMGMDARMQEILTLGSCAEIIRYCTDNGIAAEIMEEGSDYARVAVLLQNGSFTCQDNIWRDASGNVSGNNMYWTLRLDFWGGQLTFWFADSVLESYPSLVFYRSQR